MKKVILFGAGQIGAMASRLLGVNCKPLCFIDSCASKWGCSASGLLIMSPEDGLKLRPDCILLCVMDGVREKEMREKLRERGYCGDIKTMNEFNIFDPRFAAMRLLCEQINTLNIPGAAAELGVYKGAFAAEINRSLPERRLHLFDTFEGFSESDVKTEIEQGFSKAKAKDFCDTSEELVKSALPHPQMAIFHKGLFQDTFTHCLKESFAFVSIDADLYEPTAKALPFFWDRMSPGGSIMIHDVLSTRFTGVKKAADIFCRERGLFYSPVCDLHGSVILRKTF